MSDTHWWFFDLTAVIVLTGALTFGVFSGIDGTARILLTIPLVVFFPGYALVSAMFPDKPTNNSRSFDEAKTGLGNPLLVTGGLETIERLVLSTVFSVALVSAITLLTSVTPGGLALETVLPGIALVTVALALLAIGSRYRCPPNQRFIPPLSMGGLFFTQQRPTAYDRSNTRPYNIAIVIGLLLLVASGGFAITNQPQSDGFTEFSVDTENVTGETDSMYESTYTAGESQEVQATITNQEHEEHTYTTVVLLEGVSYDDGGVTVHETDEVDRASATVADGDTHQQTLEFTPSMEDNDLRLTLLLYDGEPPAEPTAENAYRTVQLPIEVES
ncbi:DUF1616 domain-containing protein [Natronorubrum bangense]|uniref:DUF1616 domain-containing protein n=2 Tax=Natronorubrum bangense TaxID=61858 RepID=L9WFN9_9EURY|nr:DUF1616 domain-containing protein [Natronorubrum bangense]ELY47113.1 hypothetical protein C494_12951 [Natronorubrum bangense JCM 10635]QCC53447.1 DUF1616 domain-containing protein [Natronorubrum bangense]